MCKIIQKNENIIGAVSVGAIAGGIYGHNQYEYSLKTETKKQSQFVGAKSGIICFLATVGFMYIAKFICDKTDKAFTNQK